jgi:hypothetical protein
VKAVVKEEERLPGDNVVVVEGQLRLRLLPVVISQLLRQTRLIL